ncbi:hypothetical protein BB559_000457 [Furculomyces boomerangus]|uniref:Kinesin motor domain-containing protein n=1 Tax=Furculomyces boomerangus TaxID=61424 RepID=A0A2T9Z5B8_9FUNG|nr:hypothetical protein BB559_000457 [Furculomyces boomerangus]
MKDNINVAIRIRPLNDRELSESSDANSLIPWTVNGNSISQKLKIDNRISLGPTYTFDTIYDQQKKSQDIYNCDVKGIVASSMNGINGTVFAYGQTSSGKTYTMYGDENEPGIIKMAVRNVFEHIKNTPERQFLIRVSYLEIYNEVISDLIDTSKKNLRIGENLKREIFVRDSTEQIVLSPQEVDLILQRGEKNRHIGCTNMNERSSRSHTIFRIIIESGDKKTNDEKPGKRLSENGIDGSVFSGSVKISSLSLVDLAGSERVGHTGAEGMRLREGAHINKSLLALGTVIAKLAESDSDRGHIPYRDSKLTRILQSSLGGNSRTVIICTITLAEPYSDETHSTLKFANRAKTITNQPEINVELRGDALLRRLKRVDQLEKEVFEMQKVSAMKDDMSEQNKILTSKLNWSENNRQKLEFDINSLKEEISSIKDNIKVPAIMKTTETQTELNLIENFENSIQNLNQNLHSLSEEVDNKNQEIQKYKTALEISEENNTISKNRYTEIQTAMELQKQQLNAMLENAIKEKDKYIEELKKSILNLENQNLKQSVEVEKLVIENNNYKLTTVAEISTIRNSLDEQLFKTKKLEELYTISEKNLSDKSKELEQMEISHKDKVEEIKLKLIMDIENKERDLKANFDKELALKDNILIELEKENQDLNKKIQTNKIDTDNEITNLQKKLDEARELNKEIVSEKQNILEDSFKNKELELNDTRDKNHKEMQDLKDEIKKYSLENSVLEKARISIELSLSENLDKTKAIEQEISEQKIKFSELNELYLNSKEISKLAEEKIKAQETDISNYQSQIAHISERAEEAENDFITQIKNANDEKNHLFEKLKFIQDQIEKEMLKCDEVKELEDFYQKEIKELEDKNSSMSEKIKDFEILVEKLNKESIQVSSELEANLKNKIEQLEASNKEFSLLLEESRSKVIEVNENYSRLETEFKNLKDNYDNLSKELSINLAEKESKDETLQVTRKKLDQLAESMSKEKEEYVKKIEDLEQSLVETKSEIENLNKKVNKATIENEELLAKVNDLTQDISNRERVHEEQVEKDKADLLILQNSNTENLSKIKIELDNQILKNNNLSQEINSYKSDIEKMKLEKESFENSIKNTNDSVNKYKDQINILESKLIEKEEFVSNLESKISQIDKELVEKNNQIQEQCEKIKILEIEIEKVENEIDFGSQNSEEHNRVVSERDRAMNMIEKAKSMMIELASIKDSEIENLEKELEKTKDSLKTEIEKSKKIDLDSIKNDYKNQISKLKQEHENTQKTTNDEIAKLQTKIDELNYTISETKQRLEVAEKTKMKALGSIGELQTQLEERKRTLKEKIEIINNNDQKVKSLYQQLDQAKYFLESSSISQNDTIKDIEEDYNSQINSLNDKIDIRDKILNEVRQDLESANQEIEKMKNELEEEKSRYENKIATVEANHEKTISQLESEKQKLEDEVASKNEYISGMLERLKALKTSVLKINQDKTALEKRFKGDGLSLDKQAKTDHLKYAKNIHKSFFSIIAIYSDEIDVDKYKLSFELPKSESGLNREETKSISSEENLSIDGLEEELLNSNLNGSGGNDLNVNVYMKSLAEQAEFLCEFIQSKVASYEQKNSELTSKLEEVDFEFEDKSERIANVENELREKKLLISRYEDKIQRILDDLDSSNAKCDTLQEKIKSISQSKQQEINKLLSQHQSVIEGIKKSSEKQIYALRSVIDEQLAKLDAANTEVQRLVERNNHLLSESEGIVDQSERNTGRMRYNSDTKNVTQFSGEGNPSEITSYKLQIKNLRSQLAELRNELKKQMFLKSSEMSSSQNLKAQVAELVAERDMLRMYAKENIDEKSDSNNSPIVGISMDTLKNLSRAITSPIKKAPQNTSPISSNYRTLVKNETRGMAENKGINRVKFQEIHDSQQNTNTNSKPDPNTQKRRVRRRVENSSEETSSNNMYFEMPKRSPLPSVDPIHLKSVLKPTIESNSGTPSMRSIINIERSATKMQPVQNSRRKRGAGGDDFSPECSQQ